MGEEIRWLIGVAASVMLAFAGMLWGVFQNLSAKITNVSTATHARIDDVKEKYVRRDDLDGHLRRIDKAIEDMKNQQERNHGEVMDALLKRAPRQR